VLDVTSRLEEAVVGELVPLVRALEHVISAVKREPANGGGTKTRYVLGQARDDLRWKVEAAAVSDGAERAIRKDHPRKLTYVEARGGVPSTAHSTEAGAVGRQRKASKHEAEEIG
jgi:hypothetical protein